MTPILYLLPCVLAAITLRLLHYLACYELKSSIFIKVCWLRCTLYLCCFACAEGDKHTVCYNFCSGFDASGTFLHLHVFVPEVFAIYILIFTHFFLVPYILLYCAYLCCRGIKRGSQGLKHISKSGQKKRSWELVHTFFLCNHGYSALVCTYLFCTTGWNWYWCTHPKFSVEKK